MERRIVASKSLTPCSWTSGVLLDYIIEFAGTRLIFKRRSLFAMRESVSPPHRVISMILCSRAVPIFLLLWLVVASPENPPSEGVPPPLPHGAYKSHTFQVDCRPDSMCDDCVLTIILGCSFYRGARAQKPDPPPPLSAVAAGSPGLSERFYL